VLELLKNLNLVNFGKFLRILPKVFPSVVLFNASSKRVQASCKESDCLTLLDIDDNDNNNIKINNAIL